MFKKILLVAALALATTGCASVKMASPAQDKQAKQFTTKPDVAGVYVYRNEFAGASVKMDVHMDGNNIGQTAAGTYLYTEVKPGPHKLTSEAENVSELSFDALSGNIYYVWQEVKMGVMFARNKIQMVDETTGQKGVKETKLAAPPTITVN